MRGKRDTAALLASGVALCVVSIWYWKTYGKSGYYGLILLWLIAFGSAYFVKNKSSNSNSANKAGRETDEPSQR